MENTIEIGQLAVIKIFGLPNCDTCRCSLNWMKNNDLSYEFHDIRNSELISKSIKAWACAAGWELLLNRQSRTWRSLPESQRKGIDEVSAIRLMIDNPTLIKRPVFDLGDKIFVGFKAEQKKILEIVRQNISR